MISEIPCTPAGESHWSQLTTLAGRNYLLEFDWNQRDGKWYLTLALEDGTVIRRGIPVVSDYPLLWGLIDARRPPGELIVRDTVGGPASEERNTALDPAFDDLGARFVLCYIDPEDLEG